MAFVLRRCGGQAPEDVVYAALNGFSEGLQFELPRPPGERRWHVAVSTAMPPPHDAWELGQEPRLEDQVGLQVAGRSAVVLVAR